MDWTSEEKRFLRSLNTPYKIQNYLDGLTYNPDDSCLSPRYVMLTEEGHCLEGGLLAACALELQGHPPLMVHFRAEEDSHHVITVYKTRSGWGSLAKSNTTLLRGRTPVYASIRELAMSYFDFYFNLDRKLSLWAFSDPINLNLCTPWNWRTGDEDLMEMGMDLDDFPHHEIIDLKGLKGLPKISLSLRDAGFLGADPEGLYQGN